MSGWIAAAVGGAAVVGGAVSYFGAQDAAHAAQNAALQQQDQANKNRANAMGFANASPQELNILGQSYDAASTHLKQQQKLMDSIDPSLMEASKQALAILQGGDAASTQPMFHLRNSQREQLVQSLRAQYGPGAESTSIGQRALQQFDMATQNMQTSQLGNLMDMANNQQANNGFNNAVGSLQQVGQGYSNIQTRQLNASLGVGSQMLQTAGANQAGAALAGQGQAALGNNIMNTGASLGSMYAFGRGMRPDPKTIPTTGSGVSQPVAGASQYPDPSWYFGNSGSVGAGRGGNNPSWG